MQNDELPASVPKVRCEFFECGKTMRDAQGRLRDGLRRELDRLEDVDRNYVAQNQCLRQGLVVTQTEVFSSKPNERSHPKSHWTSETRGQAEGRKQGGSVLPRDDTCGHGARLVENEPRFSRAGGDALTGRQRPNDV
ncbi:MAG: hypothetical protein QM784_33865 [Polyangiaceae bacterium]